MNILKNEEAILYEEDKWRQKFHRNSVAKKTRSTTPCHAAEYTCVRCCLSKYTRAMILVRIPTIGKRKAASMSIRTTAARPAPPVSFKMKKMRIKVWEHFYRKLPS